MKVEQVNKILRNINSRKSTGPEKIPPRIVKMQQVLSTLILVT